MSVRLEAAYRLDDQVALRREAFGALCYHFGNRRLTFLKSREMVTVVEGLGSSPSVAASLRAAGVEEQRWPAFVRGLTSLEASEIIRER